MDIKFEKKWSTKNPTVLPGYKHNNKGCKMFFFFNIKAKIHLIEPEPKLHFKMTFKRSRGRFKKIPIIKLDDYYTQSNCEFVVSYKRTAKTSTDLKYKKKLLKLKIDNQ